MTQHHLFRCKNCGVVSIYDTCQNDPTHSMRQLPTKLANEYVRIGHNAFTRIPEPTQRPMVKGHAS